MVLGTVTDWVGRLITVVLCIKAIRIVSLFKNNDKAKKHFESDLNEGTERLLTSNSIQGQGQHGKQSTHAVLDSGKNNFFFIEVTFAFICNVKNNILPSKLMRVT
jgi:hypothetical protein